jgi:hypothetical protein
MVVMLSDNLVAQRFVEECQFMKVGSAEAAYLSTWKFMLRRSSCLVCSLPDAWDSGVCARSWRGQVRAASAAALRRTGPRRPQDIHLVMVGGAAVFDKLVEEGLKFNDRTPFHFNRIVGTLLVDREGMRVVELPSSIGSPSRCLGLIANHVKSWIRMNLRLTREAAWASSRGRV